MFANSLEVRPLGNTFPSSFTTSEKRSGGSVGLCAHSHVAAPHITVQPQASSFIVPIGDSTRRYIECLELEVQHLTRQYEGASQLLYQAVLAQEACNTDIDESTTRMTLVELECSERVGIVQFMFSLAIACCRTKSTPVEEGNTLLCTSSQGGSEIPYQIPRPFGESLRVENRHTTQLVESVPHRLCSALTAPETQMSRNTGIEDITQCTSRKSPTARQRLECTVDPSENVGMALVQNVMLSRSGLNDSPERVATLRQNVGSQENSSQCLMVEVRLHVEQKDPHTQEEFAALPSLEERMIEAAPCTSELSTPVVCKDLQLFSTISQRSFGLLQSMMLEYVFTLEQMQAIAEKEMNSLISVNERKAYAHWNSLLKEREVRIHQWEKKMEKLQKYKSECEKENKKEDNIPISQLYTQYAAPYIPYNLKKSKRVKLQSMADLRRDAMRVGARPARFASPSRDPKRRTHRTPSPRSELKESHGTPGKKLHTVSAPPAVKSAEATAIPPVSEVVAPAVSSALERIFSKETLSPRRETKRVTPEASLAQETAVLLQTAEEAPPTVSDMTAAIRTFKRFSSSSSSFSSASAGSCASRLGKGGGDELVVASQRTRDSFRGAQADLQSVVSSTIKARDAKPSALQEKSDDHGNDVIKNSTLPSNKELSGIQTEKAPSSEKMFQRIAPRHSFDDSSEGEGDNHNAACMTIKLSEVGSTKPGSATVEPVMHSTLTIRNRKLSGTSPSLDTTLTLSSMETTGGSITKNKKECKTPGEIKDSVSLLRGFSFEKDRSLTASSRNKSKAKSSSDDKATDAMLKLQKLRF